MGDAAPMISPSPQLLMSPPPPPPPPPTPTPPLPPPSPPAAAALPAVGNAAAADTDRRFSAQALREAFERPQRDWAAVAAVPAVAHALAAFPSELDTRPKGRLDLVSWVACMSGFGCDGPSDGSWHALFSACSFAPLRMTELQIATLVAARKCCTDMAPDVSERSMVKMRIRPAVEGRIDARAPGILLQVQRKYDDFVYSVLPKHLIQQALREMDPAGMLLAMRDCTSGLLAAVNDSISGSARASSTPVSGETMKILCEREVEEKMKKWESVIVKHLRLDLSGDPTGRRLLLYMTHRDAHRTQLRDALSNSLHMYLLDRQVGWMF